MDPRIHAYAAAHQQGRLHTVARRDPTTASPRRPAPRQGA